MEPHVVRSIPSHGSPFLNSSPMIGSPNRNNHFNNHLKSSNPADYGPVLQFAQWQHQAGLYDYYIVIGDNNFPIPYNRIQYHQYSLSFDYTWDMPFNLRIPFKFEIYGQYNSDSQHRVGDKRKNLDGLDSSPSKKMKGPSGREIVPPFQKNRNTARPLFSETVNKVSNNYWTDRSGKVKVHASYSGSPSVIKLNSMYFTIHGQKFIKDSKNPIPVHLRTDKHLGLRDFAVFVSIRDSISNEILLELCSLQENITKVESPFRQTVSLQMIKSPVIVNKKFLTGNPLVDGPSHLVADLTIFDPWKNSFYSRSGFLWLDSHTPGVYYGSMLASLSESGYVTIHFKGSSTHTIVHSCLITLTLSKITQWFEKQFTGHKIPIVSKALVDGCPVEDPFDVFSA